MHMVAEPSADPRKLHFRACFFELLPNSAWRAGYGFSFLFCFFHSNKQYNMDTCIS